MKSRESLLRLKRFHLEEKRRQGAQIEAMIADFERMAKELDDQIASEEKRTGITDINHFAYSTFAKSAMARRDNLAASAQNLQAQLAAEREELAEASADVEKLEAIAERDQGRAGEKEAQEEPRRRGRNAPAALAG